eukprot:Skav230532  [mRNA]  locus=scaffold1183:193993:195333:- [translate_table: standard]
MALLTLIKRTFACALSAWLIISILFQLDWTLLGGAPTSLESVWDVGSPTSPATGVTQQAVPTTELPSVPSPPETVPKLASDRLTQCVQDVGVFNNREVEIITTELQRQRDFLKRRPLVFTHIPKTGGTSVTTAFNKAFTGLGCGMIRPKKQGSSELKIKNGKATGKHRCFVLDMRSGWGLWPWAIFAPETWLSSELPPMETIIAVEGHVPFGICRFFGGAKRSADNDRSRFLGGENSESNCSYTTVLREPIERYVSHVRWQCQKAASSPNELHFCNSSIAEYTKAVLRGDVFFYGVDNHQTRMLSGDASENSDGLPCFNSSTCTSLGFGEVGTVQLKTAILNLVRRYPVWGVLDDMDSFADRLQMTYGYSFKFQHENQGRFSMNKNLTAETYKDLETLLALDLSLYRFAKCALDAGSPRFRRKSERSKICSTCSDMKRMERGLCVV